MGKKRTREEIEEIVNELGYDLLDEYFPENDRKHRRVIFQDKTGYKYDSFLETLLQENNVFAVSKANIFSLENISLWLKLNRPDFELCENNTYKDNTSELTVYHSISDCAEVFISSWDSMYRGRGCAVCRGLQVGQYNNLAYLKPELVLEWDYEKNELRPEEVTCGSHKKVWWICPNCNKSYISSVNHRCGKGTSCPKCKLSKGERKIETFLHKHNFEFVSQATFDKCKNIYNLYFDFYIPSLNLCIEYNGQQHYEETGYFGGNAKLKRSKKNDLIKKKYCKTNNIRLLVIPYWEINNVEEILTETLF